MTLEIKKTNRRGKTHILIRDDNGRFWARGVWETSLVQAWKRAAKEEDVHPLEILRRAFIELRNSRVGEEVSA